MKKHDTKLIDGNFTVQKANIVLSELLSYKINFHNLEKFSNEERFGKDYEHSEKRIKELNKEKTELGNWLQSLNETDKIKIKCTISLKVKD